MTPSLSRGLLISAIFAVVATLSLAVGSLMHESDQASLLRGGIRLAEGRISPLAADFYNYDKQFAAYWALAIADRIFPGVDRVLLGNVLSFAVFWSGLLAWVWTLRIRGPLQPTAIFACLVAPVFWVHSAFLASAFLASGWLFWACAWWIRTRRHPWLRWPTIGLLALSVGSRVDIVLLFPLLAWLVTPASGFGRLLRRPKPFVLAAVAVMILLIGRTICRGTVVDGNPPFFFPKVFAAFLVFGLGSAAIVSMGNVVSLAKVIWKRKRRPSFIFYALGIAGLLLPSAFYSVQMLSPRYWVLTLCAQLLFLGSRRGRILWRIRPAAWGTWGALALVVFALIPIFVGVRLPLVTTPKLVGSRPTLFPSADGLIPMGAMGWYVWAQRATPSGFDHNQSTWLAARATDYQVDGTGSVPLLRSVLQTYPELAIELQGRTSRAVSLENPFFYVDLRQILRANNAFSGLPDFDRGKMLETYRLEPVSQEFNGYRMVRGEPGEQSALEIFRDIKLADIFEGAEFQPPLQTVKQTLKNASSEGKAAVLFAEGPFSILLTEGNGSGTRLEGRPVPGLGYALKLSSKQSGIATVESGQDLKISLSRLPEYMILQNL